MIEMEALKLRRHPYAKPYTPEPRFVQGPFYTNRHMRRAGEASKSTDRNAKVREAQTEAKERSVDSLRSAQAAILATKPKRSTLTAEQRERKNAKARERRLANRQRSGQ